MSWTPATKTASYTNLLVKVNSLQHAVTEFWVLNEDVQELVPSKVGKWMYFPNFEATSVNLDELKSIFSEAHE